VFSSLAYPYFEVDIERNRINKKLNKLNDFCPFAISHDQYCGVIVVMGGGGGKLQFNMGRLLERGV